MISTFKNRRIMAALSTNVSIVAPWWLSGGIPAANAIGSYRAKGAATLAASYINLANSGVYTLTLGVAPSFNTLTGWTGAGSAYLKTGIIPVDGYSYIVSFSSYTSGVILGGRTSGTNGVYIQPNNGASKVAYAAGNSIAVTPNATSGTLAIAGKTAYRNGVPDGTIGAGSITTIQGIYILALNGNGSASVISTAVVTAFSAYNTTLSGPQVLALHNAMAAL